MQMSWFKYTGLLILLSLLYACGFHLRGQINLPVALQPLYLDSKQPYATFEKLLRQNFASSNITLASSRLQANGILQIINTESTRMVTNTSANAQTQTVSLTYQVSYQLFYKKALLIGPRTISIHRTYTANTSQMLGSNAQEQNFINSMRQQVAFLLFNQLTSEQVNAAIAKHS